MATIKIADQITIEASAVVPIPPVYPSQTFPSLPIDLGGPNWTFALLSLLPQRQFI